MDKKITRRAVLGTAVAALAAGPFAIRSLRGKRGLDSEYGRLLELAGSVGSDLSPTDVLGAVELFSEERDRWLSLRGVSALVSFRVSAHLKDDVSNTVSLGLDGPMSWSLVNSNKNGRYPFVFKLESRGSGSGQMPWIFETNGDNQSARRTGGDFAVVSCAPVIVSMLEIPVKYFWDYIHTNERGVLDASVPFATRKCEASANCRVFASREKRFEVCLHDGFYSGCDLVNDSPGREGQKTSTVVEKHELVGGWSFPSVFRSSYEVDSKLVNCELCFSNISLTTVPYRN